MRDAADPPKCVLGVGGGGASRPRLGEREGALWASPYRLFSVSFLDLYPCYAAACILCNDRVNYLFIHSSIAVSPIWNSIVI